MVEVYEKRKGERSMIYLLLAICASFSITLLIKDNETHGASSQVVLAGNYLTAGIIGWLFVLGEGSPSAGRVTLALGLGGGVLWPGAFYLLMWGIRHYGVALAGSVSRLSLSVPVLFAVAFLDERLTLPIALGIAGAFGAFLLLSPFKRGQAIPLDRRAIWYFPSLVLIFGLVDVWANLYATWAPPGEKALFMVLIFTGSAIVAWTAVAVRRLQVTTNAVVRGLILGVPNYFSTYFLLESLRSPLFAGLSAVVYALYSVIGVVLAFGAGWLLWKEPLTARHRAGVLLAVVAIALLNLG
jgi:drug/metabolite transporter (DMT)-like permease